MFSPSRVIKRGALVGAVVALVVAAAALSPRRADAQVPFGCFLVPVTIVQPVATLTGFVLWQPVTILQTVCNNSFIGTPFCNGFSCIGSALSGVVPSFHSTFFRTCPSSLGCFFGNPNQQPVFRHDPCHNCRPRHVDPCHQCRPRHQDPCHSCRPKH